MVPHCSWGLTPERGFRTEIHDTGTGNHNGQTGNLTVDQMNSRNRGPLNKNNTMPGNITTFNQGKAGGTANQRGTGDLKSVAPSEIDGVDRSDVPEEYREQVGRYFAP